MDEFSTKLDEILNENLNQVILSNSRDKEKAIKCKIRPIMIKGELLFQETLYRDTRVFHENFTKSVMHERILSYITEQFKQCECSLPDRDLIVLVSKKGKMTIKEHKKNRLNTQEKQGNCADKLSHNKAKQYILQDNEPIDFLIGLGVQSPDGHIVKEKYDKFRQINRYLEFIEDILEALPQNRTIHIIDFGCGKSYLTFALYYFLHEKQGRDIEVTGLDLKKDVIAHCNALAEKLGYRFLHFQTGDISTYEGASSVDMVVSLHACDTATDYAIQKAVCWGASVILAVPCCQHEANRQIASKELQPILKYGLLKERFSAIVTDAVRANLLEQCGYQTQILEFIDMEHTPKNLLIRAVKKPGMRPKTVDVEEFTKQLHVNLTLQKLLQDKQE